MTTQVEGDRRLRTLADALDDVPQERFDIRAYFQNEGSLFTSAACALGLAAMLPEFNAEGFELSPLPNPYGTISVPCFDSPNGQQYKGVSAAKEFFGLGSVANTTYLFHERSYPKGITAKAVAQRLRDFVASRN